MTIRKPPMSNLVVYVTDREGAKDIWMDEPHIWISIYTPGDDIARIAETTSTMKVIHVCCSDLDQFPGPSFHKVHGPIKMFTEADARELSEEILERVRDGLRIFLVHCDAGVSRSGAVALAMKRCLGAKVVSKNHLSPNSLMLGLIQKAFREGMR